MRPIAPLTLLTFAAALIGGATVTGCATQAPRPAIPAASAGTQQPPGADHAQLQAALVRYLETQGNICVGKFDWPIDVTDGDLKVRSRDSIQMPVLEKLGLVRSSPATTQRPTEDGPKSLPATRYELTEAGRKFYLEKDQSTRAGGNSVEHHRDLCGARISLDKVVSWGKAEDPAGRGVVTLTYTYHAVASEWMTDPDAQRVFPMLDRVIKGDGSMQLEERLRLADGTWVPAGLE